MDLKIAATALAHDVLLLLPDGVKHGSATEVAEVNCWYHLVGVWNGSAVGIYANGRLVASQPTVGLTLNASS